MTRKGFTLIELMVVIAVIGILASIALVSIANVNKSANDAKRKSNLNDYATALALYNQDNSTYPVATKDETCSGGTTPCTATGIFTTAGALVAANYYKGTPQLDPQNGTVACKLTSSSALQYCGYKYIGTAAAYVIWAVLENPTASNGVFKINSDGVRTTQATEPTSAP